MGRGLGPMAEAGMESTRKQAVHKKMLRDLHKKGRVPPTQKQLDFCYGILERVKECEADDRGQPLFEKSMAEADRFIKKHRIPCNNEIRDRSDNCPAGDWGGIPNH